MSDKKLSIFVLMPFSADFMDVYRLAIQPAAAECGMTPSRVDEQNFFKESILERIYNQIKEADIIVAEMSGQNPNVFYEVGYAHALRKPCILLTKSADHIPFDLKHHRHIVYSSSISFLKEKLLLNFKDFQKDPQLVQDDLKAELKYLSATLIKHQHHDDAAVEISIDLHNYASVSSEPLEAIYLYTRRHFILKQEGHNCPDSRIAYKEYLHRHFVKAPLPRLPPNGWAPIKLTGHLDYIAYGDKRKDKYKWNSSMLLQIHSGHRIYEYNFPIETDVEEDPFG